MQQLVQLRRGGRDLRGEHGRPPVLLNMRAALRRLIRHRIVARRAPLKTFVAVARAIPTYRACAVSRQGAVRGDDGGEVGAGRPLR